MKQVVLSVVLFSWIFDSPAGLFLRRRITLDKACLTLSPSELKCQPKSSPACAETREKLVRGELPLKHYFCGLRENILTGSLETLICCPRKTRQKGNRQGKSLYDWRRINLLYTPDEKEPVEPIPESKIECGVMASFTKDLRKIYRLNETAKRLTREGFETTPLGMSQDKITILRVSKNNFSRVLRGGYATKITGPGSRKAKRASATFMALIGEADAVKNNEWLCSGVILNRKWILSAGHCFADGNMEVVRLGEYNFSDPRQLASEDPLDFGIERVVHHPEYIYPIAYHDLALVKLNKSIPFYRVDMRPICLPWDDGAPINIQKKSFLTIFGWGSVQYLGPKSPVLQEANVTLSDTENCNKSYSNLPSFHYKFPEGISKEKLLCAGDDRKQGTDACTGDSGGPLCYKKSNGRYTLAGIVSLGYGCGLSEYPGIYVPVRRQKYLSWIRKVAFNQT